HVSSPENKIAAPARSVRHDLSNRRALHVAIARAGEAAGGERDLHQPGAVEPKAGLAAPHIRRAEKTPGDRDEIRPAALDPRAMRRRHVTARCRANEAACAALDREPRAQR